MKTKTMISHSYHGYQECINYNLSILWIGKDREINFQWKGYYFHEISSLKSRLTNLK